MYREDAESNSIFWLDLRIVDEGWGYLEPGHSRGVHQVAVQEQLHTTALNLDKERRRKRRNCSRRKQMGKILLPGLPVCSMR